MGERERVRERGREREGGKEGGRGELREGEKEKKSRLHSFTDRARSQQYLVVLQLLPKFFCRERDTPTHQVRVASQVFGTATVWTQVLHVIMDLH